MYGHAPLSIAARHSPRRRRRQTATYDSSPPLRAGAPPPNGRHDVPGGPQLRRPICATSRRRGTPLLDRLLVFVAHWRGRAPRCVQAADRPPRGPGRGAWLPRAVLASYSTPRSPPSRGLRPAPRPQQVAQTQEMYEDGGSGESRVRVQRRLGDQARTVTKSVPPRAGPARPASGFLHSHSTPFGPRAGRGTPRARSTPRTRPTA